MNNKIKSFFSEIEKTIKKSFTHLPETREQIYVGSFWLFYSDYTVIHAPCFGFNTVDKIIAEDKWAPPEWENDIVDELIDLLSPIYEEITEYMSGKSDEEWEELLEYQWDFYSSLCKDITQNRNNSESPLKNWNTTEDFVCAILEEREGEEIYRYLVEKSIGKEKALELGILEN